MRWEILILVIFFILILPFNINIKLDINVLRNKAKIKVFLFSIIPLYYQVVEIDNGFIKLIKNPTKIRKVKLSFKKDDVTKIQKGSDIILNSQIIKNVNIFTKFGIKNQPFYVALLSGVYNIVLGLFLSINCAKRNILKSKSQLKTYFKFTYIRSFIQIKIKLTIYEIIKILIQLKTGVKA